MASPTPVLPEVGSTIVPPGWSSPEASAASIIRAAIRSFTEPPGLRYSTFASTSGVAAPSGGSGVRFRRTRGVLPTRSSSDSTYSMWLNISTGRAVAGIREDGRVDVDSPPSRTALATARYRAVHQVRDGGRVLHDPLAVQILGEPTDDLQSANVDRRMQLLVCSRARHHEEVLAAAV